MKKFLKGLAGETRNLLDGGGRTTLSNFQYYENLKQALDHLIKDERYILYFWDFRKYYPHTRPRDYHDIIKTEWSRGHEIYDKFITISLEHGISSGKREIYVRQHKDSTKYLEIEHALTPEEIRSKAGLFNSSGSYSNNNKIYYLLGYDGMQRNIEDTVFGYAETIDSFFEQNAN